MTDLEKEELSKIMTAMTNKELAIVASCIPSEIMIAELGIRLRMLPKILNLIGDAVDLGKEVERNGFV